MALLLSTIVLYRQRRSRKTRLTLSKLEQTQQVQTQNANSASVNQLIAMGDSITWGLGDGGVTYCSLLTEPAFYSLCLGFIGQTTDLGVLQGPQFANYFAPKGKFNILFDWYVSNDLEAGVANSQIVANLQAVCSTAKQMYPGVDHSNRHDDVTCWNRGCNTVCPERYDPTASNR